MGIQSIAKFQAYIHPFGFSLNSLAFVNDSLLRSYVVYTQLHCIGSLGHSY